MPYRLPRVTREVLDSFQIDSMGPDKFSYFAELFRRVARENPLLAHCIATMGGEPHGAESAKAALAVYDLLNRQGMADEKAQKPITESIQ